MCPSYEIRFTAAYGEKALPQKRHYITFFRADDEAAKDYLQEVRSKQCFANRELWLVTIPFEERIAG